MKFWHKVALGTGLLRSRLSGRRIPLVVGWALTNRCNLSCSYCTIPSIDEEELDTPAVLDIIDQLATGGCRRINFTGGEPFLRQDLETIVRHSRARGIVTGVTSNGIAALSHPRILTQLDLLILSLDGPEEIQSRYRGEGSHAAVLELLRRLPSEQLALSCVLYSQNLDHIDYVLELAKRFSVSLHVQPVAEIAFTNNDVRPYVPDRAAYERVIDHLIEVRDRYPLLNSVSSLRYLRAHPHQESLACPAGKIFFRVSTNGTLFGCYRQQNHAGVSIIDAGLEEAVRILPGPVCDGCTIADGVELTRLYQLDLGAILHALKRA